LPRRAQRFFKVRRGADIEAFAAEAAEHPVFELVPMS
jgi:hypothetical protein